MARSPEEVAEEGIADYRRHADFARETRSTDVLARLELRPSTRNVGLVSNSVRAKAKRVALRKTKRQVRRYARRFDEGEGHRVALNLGRNGELVIEQRVQDTGISDFYKIAEKTIVDIQQDYNRHYRREAKDLTRKNSRKPKIKRLIVNIISIVTKVVPAARVATFALQAATTGVRGVLDIVSALIDGIIIFLQGALEECNNKLLRGAISFAEKAKGWVLNVQDAYNTTVGQAGEYFELADKILNDFADYIAEILSGTLIGRLIAAVSSPINFLLERISGLVDSVTDVLKENLLGRSGKLFGFVICNIRAILSGEVSISEQGEIIRDEASDAAKSAIDFFIGQRYSLIGQLIALP